MADEEMKPSTEMGSDVRQELKDESPDVPKAESSTSVKAEADPLASSSSETKPSIKEEVGPLPTVEGKSEEEVQDLLAKTAKQSTSISVPLCL